MARNSTANWKWMVFILWKYLWHMNKFLHETEEWTILMLPQEIGLDKNSFLDQGLHKLTGIIIQTYKLFLFFSPWITSPLH